MTLLELLRQELPKRGGWPEGEVCILHLHDFLKKEKLIFIGDHLGSYFEDWDGNRVTREQYEATGLLQVGVEVEYMKYQRGHNDDWFIGTINYISDFTVVISQKGHKGEIVGHPVNFEFRPLRTEAERAIDEMVRLSGVSIGAAKILYDAGYRK